VSDPWRHDPAAYEEVVLVDLLDRLLDRGVVIAGDITLSVADVDLVYVGLRVLVSSASTAQRVGAPLPSSAALQRTALGSEPASEPRGDALDADALHADALHADALDADALTATQGGAASSEGPDSALDLDLGFPRVGGEDADETAR
jgi:hypothetical protein